MSYANYAPGYRVRTRTAIDIALDDVRDDVKLALVERVCANASRSALDDVSAKYCVLKGTNDVVRRDILNARDVFNVLLAFGWVVDEDEPELTLVLPRSARASAGANARATSERRLRLKRELDDEVRQKARARTMANDPAREAIRAMCENDKAERKAREPTTTGSVAVERGRGTIVTASEAGASGSSGC